MAIEWNGKARGAGWFKRGAVAAAVVMLAACGDSETYKMQKQLEAALAQAQAAQAAAVAAQAQAAQAAQAAADEEATKAAAAATKEDEAATAVADELVEQGFTVSVVAGYANCETVTSGTSVAIAVVGAPGRYFFAIKPVAPIKASGCVNPVTNSGLPDLEREAPAETDTEAAITPVTTLIVNNVPLENIRAFFDIPADVTDEELLGDPIVLAETKPKVLQASVKASAVVEAAVSGGGTQTPQEAKTAFSEQLRNQDPVAVKANPQAALAQVAASVGAQPAVLQAAADVAAAVAAELATAIGADAKRAAVKKLEAVLSVTKDVAAQVKQAQGDTTAVAQLSVQKAAEEAASNTAISNATQVFTTEETKTAAKATVKAEVKKAFANETTNAVSQADLDRAAQANAQAAAALAAANAARQAAAAAAAAAALAAQEAAAAEEARLAAQQALQQAQQNLANAGGTGGGS